ncbi:histidinol-phosphatase [Martiniozyma asiatica (nom. inval.)]|nr:histidinol-phosphatase [Martiniozyma asiatica]
MPHSHHSHSGSYCRHAHDTLPSVISTVLNKNFKTFCLTEHVPRLDNELLYPEEKDLTIADLQDQFDRYMTHAREIQDQINKDKTNRTKILVGFESEGGIDEKHLKMCLELRDKHMADVIVGSVHHLNGTDLDFDRSLWLKALKENDNNVRKLYLEYFQTKEKMIEYLKPEIVAHFDLIRLYAVDEIERDNIKIKITEEDKLNVEIEKDWPDVWTVIERCIDKIVEFGLVVELNSAAIRKGWDGPYPKEDIMQLMISKGVKFGLSDDSHGDDQVGLNYHKVIKYIKKLGIKELHYYDLENYGDANVRVGKGSVVLKSSSMEDIITDEFWRINYPNEIF